MMKRALFYILMLFTFTVSAYAQDDPELETLREFYSKGGLHKEWQQHEDKKH